MWRALSLLCGLLIVCLPANAQAEDAPFTIFAAASLRGALEEAAGDFRPAPSLSFAGSGTIARQIANGAPADVAILASPLWMAWLAERNLVQSHSIKTIARNTLVVIAPLGASDNIPAAGIPALLGSGRLAMGHRTAVPAGAYARQWLTSAGLWDALQDHLAETDNVRAALALVARGQAPMGVVYASDARADPRVEAIYLVPPASHDPIHYPAAALTPRGQALVAHLTTPKAAAIFAKHGFLGPEG